MAKKKIWFVRRISPENGISTERHPDSPMARKDALSVGAAWAVNGWRVWVDRHDTAERIFQSDSEAFVHAKLPRNVILAFPNGEFQLRRILDDGSERRLDLGRGRKLDEAYATALGKGYKPDGYIYMKPLDRLVLSGYRPAIQGNPLVTQYVKELNNRAAAVEVL